MKDKRIWHKGWALLDAGEKRRAYLVLAVVVVAALSSALMVVSVMPFLTILADPDRIQTQPQLAWAYEYFGFTSAYNYLVALGLACFAMIVFSSLIQVLKTYAVHRFSLMRMHSMSYRLMKGYLGQSYDFFLDRHSGELGTRILSESREVVLQFMRPAAEMAAAVATVLAIIVLIIWINPLVSTIAILVMGGLYGGIFALTKRFLSRIGKDRVAYNSARYRVATEAFGGVKAIKLLGREFNYLKSYAKASKRMARTEVMVMTISMVPQYALQAVALGGMLMLCVLMLEPEATQQQMGLDGILPLLGVLAFAGQRLMPELAKIYQSLSRVQASAAAVDIIYHDMINSEKTSKMHIEEAAAEKLTFHHTITLKNLSYRYPSAENAGLHDIDLTINAGERIGIVGTTGAGKTTLADIILGLLAPSDGALLIDDVTVNDDNVRCWQQNVGYVPQDIFLSDATIAENIALGIASDAIDMARVENAAKIANLDGFINEELAQGYDTLVGERGVRLSGGQIQRIGIARALYHDAELIVFDEATSALDNVTEKDVMEAIDTLPGDKTIVLIAHRLSTVKSCDRIVVLDKGKIVGFDHWDKLMETNPIFQSIASAHQTRT